MTDSIAYDRWGEDEQRWRHYRARWSPETQRYTREITETDAIGIPLRDHEGQSSGAHAPEGGEDQHGTDPCPAVAHPTPRLDLVAHIREQVQANPEGYANDAKLMAALDKLIRDLT